MTLEEMKNRKRELGYSNKQVAELSGVPIGTVQKIFSGETSAPRYETIRALEELLKPKNEYNTSGIMEDTVMETATYEYSSNSATQMGLSRFGIPIKEDGEYTLNDYLAIPDEIRAELIDGRLYMMSAPTTLHQSISAGIFTQIHAYIRANKGACIPFYAPTDVQIDSDEKTVLEPDIFVVCNRDKIDKVRIVGAPDLIIEILSSSNWQHDMIIKYKKYKSAGVREYWIVMPDQKSILVYRFEKGDEAKMYSFDDKVPIGIWDGKCEIDFKEIEENIHFLRDLN